MYSTFYHIILHYITLHYIHYVILHVTVQLGARGLPGPGIVVHYVTYTVLYYAYAYLIFIQYYIIHMYIARRSRRSDQCFTACYITLHYILYAIIS